MLLDPFGIGQRSMSRITMEVAQKAMGEAAVRAFSTGYVPHAVRDAARDSFEAFKAQYDEAKKVLEATQ